MMSTDRQNRPLFQCSWQSYREELWQRSDRQPAVQHPGMGNGITDYDGKRDAVQPEAELL